jgi:hypothetical protein
MENWREHLPEDLQTNAALLKFDDLEAVAKGYLELESFQGSSIRIPGPDASDDDKQAFTAKLIERVPSLMYKPDQTSEEQMKLFRQTLGIPDSPEDYEVKEMDPDSVKRLQGLSNTMGLTPTQHAQLVEWTQTTVTEAEKMEADAKAADNERLGEAWGPSTEQRKQRVDSVLSKVSDGDLPVLDAAGYLALDKVIDGLTGKGPQSFEMPRDVGPSVGEIKEQQSELIRKMSDVEYRPSMAERQRDMDRMVELTELLGKRAA